MGSDTPSHTAVAILYFGKPTLTLRCLQSVLSAGQPPDRIFCLDNGSDPRLSGRVREAFPQVRHYSLAENRGYSGGFNAASRWIAESGHQRLLFLTNDTEMLPGAIEACEVVATKQGAHLVAPSVRLLRNPERVDSLGARFHPETALLSHLNDPDDDSDLEPPFDYMPGTAFWLRTEAFLRLGGMDESFHTYWEDVDFCVRAHAAGFRLARAPGARILHSVGRTCHKNPLYSTYYFQRNRIRFCRRHLNADTLESALAVIRKELNERLKGARDREDQRRIKLLEPVIAELRGRTTKV